MSDNYFVGAGARCVYVHELLRIYDYKPHAARISLEKKKDGDARANR